MRKTKRQIDQTINEIGKRLSEGKLDVEIRDELGIKVSQYYAYKRKLFQRSAKQFAKQSESDLAYHKELLQNRLTNLYKHAEDKLTMVDPRDRDGQTSVPCTESKDVAPLLMAMQNIAINLFKLESEGLRILSRENGLGNFAQRRSVQFIESNTNLSGQEPDAKQKTGRILPSGSRENGGTVQTSGQSAINSTMPTTD